MTENTNGDSSMRLLKQLGKQLGFVVLMGSAIFSASSASAVPKKVTVNTDVTVETSALAPFFPSGVVKLNFVNYATTLDKTGVTPDPSPFGTLFDPFNTNYRNNQDVSSLPDSFVGNYTHLTSKLAALTGIFTGDPANPLQIGLTQSYAPNPPYFKSGQVIDKTTRKCVSPEGCIQFHFGFEFRFDTTSTATTGGIGRIEYQLEDHDKPEIKRLGEISNAGITVISALEAAVTEYVVIYSEQEDPEQPGVFISNWTQIPVPERTQNPEELIKLKLDNSFINSSPVTVSNIRVLFTPNEIPLEQLNAESLAPTTENGFQVLTLDGGPSVSITLSPGEESPEYNLVTCFTGSGGNSPECLTQIDS